MPEVGRLAGLRRACPSARRDGERHDCSAPAEAGQPREQARHSRGSGGTMTLTMILTVDATHWLKPDGSLPNEPRRLRRQALRVARIIEYGGQLERGTMRETLIE